MRTRALLGACAVALMVVPGIAMGAVLFGPDDMTSATGWTTNLANTGDLATFGYDYSADGIPMAPNGSDTIGAKLEANVAGGAAPAGAVITPTGQSFSGVYELTADVWINYGNDGGTTEYTGVGFGYDGSFTPQDNFSGSGGRLLMVSDASSARDYRMYKSLTAPTAGNEQFVASGQYNVSTNNNTSGDFDTISPSVDTGNPPLDVQGQDFNTPLGGPAFNWHTIRITVFENYNIAKFWIDDLLLGVMNGNVGASYGSSGQISLSHSDRYGSQNLPIDLGFALFDNVMVTDAPEPGSMALLMLGGAALLRRRR